MNAEDSDVVRFMEIAAHLGYLGYTIRPPADDSCWYIANHPSKWRFCFTRWRAFLWLRCSLALPACDSAERVSALEALNALQEDAVVTKYHLDDPEGGEWGIEATAFLPIDYDRQLFGSWALRWIEETDKLAPICRSKNKSPTQQPGTQIIP